MKPYALVASESGFYLPTVCDSAADVETANRKFGAPLWAFVDLFPTSVDARNAARALNALTGITYENSGYRLDIRC